MKKAQEFIVHHELQWQPSYNNPTSDFVYAYRGALIIQEGEKLSADKQLPPVSTLTQVIMASKGDYFDFLACELASFSLFEPFVAKYKEVLSPEGLYIIFVMDLDGNAKFEYEGCTFYAYALDESTVWNELLDLADLSKGDLKKLSAAEKIDEVCSSVKNTKLPCPEKSYDEAKALQNGKGKVHYGAV